MCADDLAMVLLSSQERSSADPVIPNHLFAPRGPIVEDYHPIWMVGIVVFLAVQAIFARHHRDGHQE